MCRISDTARDRRKSQEETNSKSSLESRSHADLDDLLTDSQENGIGSPVRADFSPPASDIQEEEIPIEIPFTDPPPRTDDTSIQIELTTGEIETKNEPIEISDGVVTRVDGETVFERVPVETADGEEVAREEGAEQTLDSMDLLRRDLEQLSKKGPSVTQEKPLRKTGEGGEEEEGEVNNSSKFIFITPVQAEVKNEATWYSKPPMSPELLIAIAVRNLDPHKEVSLSKTW